MPLTTIDRIVDELHLQRVDLIKMDIEGSEKPALQGAARTIRRFNPRLTIATEHNADDYKAIPDYCEPSFRPTLSDVDPVCTNLDGSSRTRCN